METCRCGATLTEYCMWWEGSTIRVTRTRRPLARCVMAANSGDALRAVGTLLGQPYHDVIVGVGEGDKQSVVEGLCRKELPHRVENSPEASWV
jgi:hypothetical protein